jgi:hypothetical protein
MFPRRIYFKNSLVEFKPEDRIEVIMDVYGSDLKLLLVQCTEELKLEYKLNMSKCPVCLFINEEKNLPYSRNGGLTYFSYEKALSWCEEKMADKLRGICKTFKVFINNKEIELLKEL